MNYYSVANATTIRRNFYALASALTFPLRACVKCNIISGLSRIPFVRFEKPAKRRNRLGTV